VQLQNADGNAGTSADASCSLTLTRLVFRDKIGYLVTGKASSLISLIAASNAVCSSQPPTQGLPLFTQGEIERGIGQHVGAVSDPVSGIGAS
jgi:hypothetical protein